MAHVGGTLLSIGLFSALSVSPCVGMEIEAPTLPQTNSIVQSTVKKISKSLQGNGRLSTGRFSSNFTTGVLKTSGEIGKKTLGRPVTVRVNLSARPVGALGRVKAEPVVDLRASSKISSVIPGDLEVSFRPRADSEPSVRVLYRVSF